MAARVLSICWFRGWLAAWTFVKPDALERSGRLTRAADNKNKEARAPEGTAERSCERFREGLERLARK